MHLVTGGAGFIGRRLCAALEPAPMRVLVHRPTGDGREIPLDLVHADESTLMSVCDGIETLYHCAGYAHAGSDPDPAEAARHWQINFEATRKLVDAAGRSGVRRFILLSSVKAMGEPGRRCVDEGWTGSPDTPYGAAKRAAEEAVAETGARYGMHVVSLRLAMVYGYGGRGNLERMARMIQRGGFPPLPETGNRRSLVHVDDVVEAMRLVAERADAAGKTYIVADPVAYSGRALYDHIRAALGLRPFNWAVPVAALQTAAYCGDMLGHFTTRRLPFNSDLLHKLLGWGCYSSERIRSELGWQAHVSLAAGLDEMLQPAGPPAR